MPPPGCDAGPHHGFHYLWFSVSMGVLEIEPPVGHAKIRLYMIPRDRMKYDQSFKADILCKNKHAEDQTTLITPRRIYRAVSLMTYWSEKPGGKTLENRE